MTQPLTHSQGRRASGLSVIEVLVALAILGIVTAAILTTYVGSIRANADAGRRTQSVQILNALGRRVAGADSIVLAQPGAALTWGYGDLKTGFPELTGDGAANPDLYRASVTNAGVVTLGSAEVTHYTVEVCTRSRAEGAESCVSGDTAGVPPGPTDDEPTGLPGVN